MAPPVRRPRNARMRGITLIETLLAISVGAVLMVGGIWFLNERNNDIRDKQAAEHLRIITKAADNFVRDNFTRITDDAPRAYAIATDLASYLPANFDTNAYGQRYAVVTRPILRGGVRTGAEIMIVAGTRPGTTSIPIETKRIPGIAALAGATVGYFTQAVPAAIRCQPANDWVCGSYGGFRVNYAAPSAFAPHGLTNPVFASLLYLNGGTVTGDYLYRIRIPGHPELNTMSTDLFMGADTAIRMGAGADIEMNGNDINGAASLSSQDDMALVVRGGSLGSQDIQLNPTEEGATPGDVLVGNERQQITTMGPLGVGTGTMRTGNVTAEQIVLRSPDDLVFYDPDGSTKPATLNSFLTPWRPMAGWLVQHGRYVPKPTCRENEIPRVVFSVHQQGADIFQPDFASGLFAPQLAVFNRAYAVDQGSVWVAVFQNYTTNNSWYTGDPAAQGYAIALTYCYSALGPTAPSTLP